MSTIGDGRHPSSAALESRVTGIQPAAVDMRIVDVVFPAEITVGERFPVDITVVNDLIDPGNMVVQVLADGSELFATGGFIGGSGGWRVQPEIVVTTGVSEFEVRVGTLLISGDDLGIDSVQDSRVASPNVSGVLPGVGPLTERQRLAVVGAAGVAVGGLVFSGRARSALS